MLATKVDQSDGAIADQSALTDWLQGHLLPGRIACLGRPFPLDEATEGYEVIELTDLSAGATGGITFDHAWVNNFADTGRDPIAAVWRLFHIVTPGGLAVLTVPLGISVERVSSHPYYVGTLYRLIDPLFEVVETYVGQDGVAVVGRRRDVPSGAPSSQLNAEERAFHALERQWSARLEDLTTELRQSGARFRGMNSRADVLQRELQRKTNELEQLRAKVAKLRRWLRIPLAVLRRLRRYKAGVGRRLRRLLGRSVAPASRAAVPAAATAGHPATGTAQTSASASGSNPLTAAIGALIGGSSTPPWRDELRSGFQRWLTAARAASGPEVVVMFSGTTFVQEHRANRPIRLTNVYLERQCPVFFNYYRPGDSEPLPVHPDERLFQSPIDATQDFLDDLLTADFGDKKKIFFVSFPHEMMVRYMMLAAQHGWVTVYDTRDDWEEFAKVGMAKWYSPSYERYVAKFADVVTAVSRPLARKMEVVSGGRTVHVSPNALDTRFPRPAGPRATGGSPVIGYFGHLTDKWFDWPLVIATAQRYPAYRFELAGHQYPANLKLPPNVQLLGLVGHAELAERSRGWSVALIPFKNGPLADAVDPIKIYEYLHLRVPVLATYFPQCRDYPGTTITEGRDEFIERLDQLIGTELRDDEVAAWLARNTWEQRVDQYSALADDVRRQGRDKLATVVGGDL